MPRSRIGDRETGVVIMHSRSVLLTVFAVCVASPVVAQSTHTVRGYTRSDGTYVAPHRATNPNSTRNDNWSTIGNVNPDTGEAGTKPRDDGLSTPTAPKRRY